MLFKLIFIMLFILLILSTIITQSVLCHEPNNYKLDNC
jgi:hypothetical protein